MDETTYSDPGVIETINRRFVPIRVDNDRRPDINARYNMGGWPTTAFLTPGGRTLTGATYLPPAQMHRALEEIARFYDEQKNEIAELPATSRSHDALREPAVSGDLSDAPITRLLENLESNFDEEFGGFGDEPKFPQPEVLEFLLSEWRLSGNQRYYAMVSRTMGGMSRGGMYDHVEGGFFRYSTTRDWSVPHFEKMAEEHAGLLRVLATLAIFAPTDDSHTTLVSATNYVRNVLLDPQTGFFGGSQDADEAYFALPLDERRRLVAPFVDRTSYTNWTCALAGTFFRVARALDDDALLAQAITTLDNVASRLVDPDGLLYHVLVPGGAPEVRGLLVDHVAYLRALLDAHEASGEERFLERGRAGARSNDNRGFRSAGRRILRPPCGPRILRQSRNCRPSDRGERPARGRAPAFGRTYGAARAPRSREANARALRGYRCERRVVCGILCARATPVSLARGCRSHRR
jgi:uncharacterized protein YyaL (SSP411 family)